MDNVPAQILPQNLDIFRTFTVEPFLIGCILYSTAKHKFGGTWTSWRNYLDVSISMGWCQRYVTPVWIQWRYLVFLRTHWYIYIYWWNRFHWAIPLLVFLDCLKIQKLNGFFTQSYQFTLLHCLNCPSCCSILIPLARSTLISAGPCLSIKSVFPGKGILL